MSSEELRRWTLHKQVREAHKNHPASFGLTIAAAPTSLFVRSVICRLDGMRVSHATGAEPLTFTGLVGNAWSVTIMICATPVMQQR
jgi:hypothetical protein